MSKAHHTEASRVTIHMVCSLDGFVAKADNTVSWMESSDTYEKGVELTEEEIKKFVASIDCYVMGSKTYEHALELGWPYGDVPVFVITNRALSDERNTVEFCSGDLVGLVNDRLKRQFKNIWMVGGPELTRSFLTLNLATDIRITTMPVLLGAGVPFFHNTEIEKRLHLKDVTAYKDGMVEMWYELLSQ